MDRLALLRHTKRTSTSNRRAVLKYSSDWPTRITKKEGQEVRGWISIVVVFTQMLEYGPTKIQHELIRHEGSLIACVSGGTINFLSIC